MCETCRKSLKRSIYIQKIKTPQRKRCRYVNSEHVSRRVRYSESAINARIGREISPAQVVSVCRRDAKSNNLLESHPSKHFGCLNLSLQFLRSADSLRRMFLHRCQFFFSVGNVFRLFLFSATISSILLLLFST